MTRSDRNSRILDAATLLFLQNGLRGTTMEAVAKAAGVAKPTLYSRYPDKEALFRAVGAQVIAGFRAEFTAALQRPGSATERIAGAVSAKYDALNRLLGNSPYADEIMADHMRLNAEDFTALHGWVNSEVARMLAEDGRTNAEELARVTMAAIDGVKAEFPALADFTRLVPFVVGRLLA